jgi:hypothetical protein
MIPEEFLRAALQKLFGYTEFLPLQLEALMRVRFKKPSVQLVIATVPV